jgi:hypothetical protein
LGGFTKYRHKSTIACRIRKAMQYGNTFEEYRDILLENNSGDYASTWLLGNVHTNKICSIELGLDYHDFQVKDDGYFFGCNVAFYPPVRVFECNNTGYLNIKRHNGSRYVRIPQLIEGNKGKIDVNISKHILADHYDVYLKKNNVPCSRTVCAHYELDAREYISDPSRPIPFEPRGAIDGAIITTDMAKNMSLFMKYGSSCNIPFITSVFLKQHPQWNHLRPYLWDRPVRSWTLFY